MRYKNQLKDYSLVLIGNLILAIAVGFFIIPYNVLSGGCAGVAILLKPFIHVDTTIIVNVVVISLFIFGWITLGKSFAIKTVVSSIVYPIFLTIITYIKPDFELSIILASIYGGLLAGLGIGIVMRTGASTGGMDIPALAVNRYFHIPVSKVVLVIDACTVIGGLFIYGVEPVLVGLLSVYGTSFGIEKALTFGGKKAKAVQIISNQWQDINMQIQCSLDRGTTITPALGGYTNEKRNVILVVINQNQYQDLVNLVNEIDPNSFMIVTDTNEVHGEGFSYGIRV